MIARAMSLAPARHPDGFGPLIGVHPLMQRLYDSIERVAKRPLPLVVWGPTGSGKELVARAVHDASGRPGRYVALNVHALPEGLADTELFGVVRGAYTGADTSRKGLIEAAAGGTLILDEANELPRTLQAKLLRAVETGEVRAVGGNSVQHVEFRLIVCTQVRPAILRTDGQWRDDFYFRVSGFGLEVPALRDRLSDLPVLVALMARRLGIAEVELPAVRLLERHTWSGNVRELMRVVEHAAVLADSRRLDASSVRTAIAALVNDDDGNGAFDAATLFEVERAHIDRVLRATQWDIEATRRVLGLSRSGLYRRLQRHGLTARARESSSVSGIGIPDLG